LKKKKARNKQEKSTQQRALFGVKFDEGISEV
jgi:hypothetical protein